MKIKNVQLLYTGHLIASILLFFIGLIYLRSIQAVLANIEITGFDPLAYDEPTHNFAQIAVFFCALTIFVGYKTYVKLPLIGRKWVCFFRACFDPVFVASLLEPI